MPETSPRLIIPESVKQAARLSVLIGIAGAMCLGGVSIGIRNRTLREYDYKSAITGREKGEYPVEIAHLDHTRNKNYEKPFNIRPLVTSEHYMDHYVSREMRLDDTGLNKKGHNWALGQMWERMNEDLRDEVKEKKDLFHHKLKESLIQTTNRDNILKSLYQ